MEKYLGNKFVGAKRFGVEGGESFIPMVNELIQRAGSVGCKEVVIGMPHRGRLNLLVNIMGKTRLTCLVSSKANHYTRKVLVTLSITKVSLLT